MCMSDNSLPGIRPMPKDLFVADQAAFLRNLPMLIRRLKMRLPALAWNLDLSVSSLEIVDNCISAELMRLQEVCVELAEGLDRNLMEQLTAYVGEVIRRNKGGSWQVQAGKHHGGPYLVFPRNVNFSGKEPVYKAVDVYQHILRIIVEGESVSTWYDLEIEGRT